MVLTFEDRKFVFDTLSEANQKIAEYKISHDSMWSEGQRKSVTTIIKKIGEMRDTFFDGLEVVK